MKRRTFDRAFKMAAVKMILDEDIPVSTVAEELSVHRNTLYLWLREVESFGENAFPGHGNEIRNYQFEIRRLEKETGRPVKYLVSPSVVTTHGSEDSQA